MGAYARGGGDPEKQYATFPRLKERRRRSRARSRAASSRCSRSRAR